jgi:hypothetical protein
MCDRASATTPTLLQRVNVAMQSCNGAERTQRATCTLQHANVQACPRATSDRVYSKPDMPINPNFHAFGAPLVYRQQEPNLQRKLDPKGHRARYLGPAEQHGCVYVLDLDIASTPIRITNIGVHIANHSSLTLQQESSLIQQCSPSTWSINPMAPPASSTSWLNTSRYRSHLTNSNELPSTKNSVLHKLNNYMIKVSVPSRPTLRFFVNFIEMLFARHTVLTHRLLQLTRSLIPQPMSYLRRS